MAESFTQGFFRGFAEQATKDNEEEFKNNLAIDQGYKLQAQRIKLEQVAKMAEDHQKQQEQNAADVLAEKKKQEDIQTKLRMLGGNVEGAQATGSGPSSQAAMPNGIDPSQPMDGQSNQPDGSTQQHPSMNPQPQVTQQGAAPVSPAGSITSSDVPPPQGTPTAQNVPSQPPAPVSAQPVQPGVTPENAAPTEGALPQTAPAGQSTTPEEFTQPPQAQPDQNILGKQYGLTPMSWISKNPAEVASTTISGRLNQLGVPTDPSTVQKYTQTVGPEQALSPYEKLRYASIADDKETERQVIIKNSPGAAAWYAAHNLTTDGKPMPDTALPKPNAKLWDTTINRPYGTLKDVNSYYEKAQDKINNPNSSVYKDIIAPAQLAQNKLQYLGTQEAINGFVVSGPAETTQDTYEKVKAQVVGGKMDGVAAMDALAGHLLGNEKRDIFSNTKGRVTNQEAMQFFKALPDLQNSELGRQFIITYMTGQSAQDLAVSNLKEQYRNDNNGLYDTAHAAELEQAYRTANPIFTGKIDFNNPKAMINPNVMSPENWLAKQRGEQLNPDDSLRKVLNIDTIVNGNTVTSSNPATNSPNLTAAFKQFGL